jgi:hypothetical protein
MSAYLGGSGGFSGGVEPPAGPARKTREACIMLFVRLSDSLYSTRARSAISFIFFSASRAFSSAQTEGQSKTELVHRTISLSVLGAVKCWVAAQTHTESNWHTLKSCLKPNKKWWILRCCLKDNKMWRHESSMKPSLSQSALRRPHNLTVDCPNSSCEKSVVYGSNGIWTDWGGGGEGWGRRSFAFI